MAADVDVNPAARRPPLDAPVLRAEHHEGSLTRLLEHQTAKISSDVFLAAALVSMGASLFFEATGRVRASRFVGMWPGPLLVMGVYNKLVKVLGPR